MQLNSSLNVFIGIFLGCSVTFLNEVLVKLVELREKREEKGKIVR